LRLKILFQMFRYTTRFAGRFVQVARPSLLSQSRFGSGPAALTVQQIETRILELLRNYDKVQQEKVL
jgi:hypothetical protein